MSEDINYQLQQVLDLKHYVILLEQIKENTLAALELLFNANSTSVTNFRLLAPSLDASHNTIDRPLLEELDYNLQKLQLKHAILLSQLNDEQRVVYDQVLRSVISCEGGFYFVYGHGGTDKTFLWKTIIAAIRSYGHVVWAVASSGIASLLLPGGRTAHSWFKIPLDVDQLSTCEIKKGTQLARLVQKTVLIVWDEALMIQRNCLEALDRTLQDLMTIEQPNEEKVIFGGKTLLLRGDFRQILPVIPSGLKEDIITTSICKSPLWKYCKVLRLKTNMRLLNNSVDDQEKIAMANFAQWILDIGDGIAESVFFDPQFESAIIKIP